MKGLDVFIVRFLPFLLYIIIGINIWGCWNGESFEAFNLLHGNSAIYATSLFFISLAHKRYHCVYNRAMYIFLIFTPIFNYLDYKFEIFDTAESYLYVIVASYGLTAVVTAYLAIRHFVQVTKRRMSNGRE